MGMSLSARVETSAMDNESCFPMSNSCNGVSIDRRLDCIFSLLSGVTALVLTFYRNFGESYENSVGWGSNNKCRWMMIHTLEPKDRKKPAYSSKLAKHHGKEWNRLYLQFFNYTST